MKGSERVQQLCASASLIQGKWVEGSEDSQAEVRNPFNNELIGHVPQLAEADIEKAIDSCAEAQEQWQGKTARERSNILLRWHQLLLDNKKALAELMTLEQGKVLAEAEGEIVYSASYLRWFSEEAVRNYGDTIAAAKNDQQITVKKFPIGVCAAITPWNFPMAMLARKVAAALAAGCTMVAKPSDQTPYSALALAKLGLDAGLPPGVFNVVTGKSSTIGQVFCANAKIKKISFTGSTRVGRILTEQSAQHLQRLSMELGGNAPFIVFEGADLDAAVEGLVAAKFRNAGQTCICVNRLFVHESISEEFLQKLKVRMQGLKVGNGLDKGVDIGPLINGSAVEKFNEHYRDALAKGGQLLLGGEADESSNLVQPSLMQKGSADMQFCQEESFSPLLVAINFKSESEVMKFANATPYGLAAYFYSGDYKQIHRVAEQLKAGMVGVNAVNLSNAMAPFGGVDQSGQGREGSKYGLEDYLEIKYILNQF